MSEKHTPEPWKVARFARDEIRVISEGCPAHIARVCWTEVRAVGGHLHTEEREANAALIAAAPELLAACRLFIKSFENNAVDFQQQALPSIARAAIAKATGE